MRIPITLLAFVAVACSGGTRSGGTAGAPGPSANTATASGTVIVANMGDNTATLLDVASKRVVATLPTGNGAHEVAVSYDGRLYFGVTGDRDHAPDIDVLTAGIDTGLADLLDSAAPVRA